jgi:hypothetical protein
LPNPEGTCTSNANEGEYPLMLTACQLYVGHKSSVVAD